MPVAAIHRRLRKLPPTLRKFLQSLQLPEPGKGVLTTDYADGRPQQRGKDVNLLTL